MSSSVHVLWSHPLILPSHAVGQVCGIHIDEGDLQHVILPYACSECVLMRDDTHHAGPQVEGVGGEPKLVAIGRGRGKETEGEVKWCHVRAHVYLADEDSRNVIDFRETSHREIGLFNTLNVTSPPHTIAELERTVIATTDEPMAIRTALQRGGLQGLPKNKPIPTDAAAAVGGSSSAEHEHKHATRAHKKRRMVEDSEQ